MVLGLPSWSTCSNHSEAEGHFTLVDYHKSRCELAIGAVRSNGR